ncbi:hypothetical protein DIPPA_03771 [Diplonema papillatum]|nr:hypothetical protein DIPPA_03771 [Diplonema papillatum]
MYKLFGGSLLRHGPTDAAAPAGKAAAAAAPEPVPIDGEAMRKAHPTLVMDARQVAEALVELLRGPASSVDKIAPVLKEVVSPGMWSVAHEIYGEITGEELATAFARELDSVVGIPRCQAVLRRRGIHWHPHKPPDATLREIVHAKLTVSRLQAINLLQQPHLRSSGHDKTAHLYHRLHEGKLRELTATDKPTSTKTRYAPTFAAAPAERAEADWNTLKDLCNGVEPVPSADDGDTVTLVRRHGGSQAVVGVVQRGKDDREAVERLKEGREVTRRTVAAMKTTAAATKQALEADFERQLAELDEEVESAITSLRTAQHTTAAKARRALADQVKSIDSVRAWAETLDDELRRDIAAAAACLQVDRDESHQPKQNRPTGNLWTPLVRNLLESPDESLPTQVEAREERLKAAGMLRPMLHGLTLLYGETPDLAVLPAGPALCSTPPRSRSPAGTPRTRSPPHSFRPSASANRLGPTPAERAHRATFGPFPAEDACLEYLSPALQSQYTPQRHRGGSPASDPAAGQPSAASKAPKAAGDAAAAAYKASWARQKNGRLAGRAVVSPDGLSAKPSLQSACKRNAVATNPTSPVSISGLPPRASPVTCYWEVLVGGFPGDSTVGIVPADAKLHGPFVGCSRQCVGVHLCPSEQTRSVPVSGVVLSSLGDFADGDTLGVHLRLFRSAAAPSPSEDVLVGSVLFYHKTGEVCHGLASHNVTVPSADAATELSFALAAVISSHQLTLTLVPDAKPPIE